MFCLNLFQKKQTKGKYALEAFKKVPKNDMDFYSYSKNKLRYQKGYFLDNRSSMKLDQFVNTKPEISMLYQEKETNLLEKANQEYFLRKILKSQFQELIEKSKSQTRFKFTDPDFPPNQSSIGGIFKGLKIEWKRIPDIIKDPQFICDTVSPEDVYQGQLGNCYFLSAVSALAQNDFRVKNIFGSLKMNSNGFYMARIMFRGVYQEVVVDDFIPIGNNNHPLFAKPTKKNQIWVMILQKCWAKLFGSYENTVSILFVRFNLGGFPNEVLHAFSSAPTFQHKVSQEKQKIHQLFDILFKQDTKGSVMCCGTVSQQEILKFGLINDHAYALLQVFQQPFKMLKLRNPWGNIEWAGKASRYDTQFWKNLSAYDKQRIGYSSFQTGTFFILWQDFIRYFKLVDVCKIQDNANYFFIEESFFKQHGKIFDLQSKLQNTELTIALSQTNLRGNKNKKLYGRAIIILGKVPISTGKFQIVTYKYITSNSGKNYADFYMHVPNLQKGNYKVYTEVQWESEVEDVAVVSIYTEGKATLKQNTKANGEQFLYNVFVDHASKNLTSTQFLSKDPLQYICYDLLINNCGYGYIVIHLGPKSKRKLGLQFNQKDYIDKKLKLLEPYKGKGKFKITVEAGKTVIVLYKITDKLSSYPKEFALPFPKIFSLTK